METGLIPLLKLYGYTISAKPITIVYNLCRMTFAFSKDQFKVCRFTPPEHSELEDVEYFEHRLGSDVWENFWKVWGFLADFSEDSSYGIKVRYSMPYFIWSFVNIQLSSATAQLEDEFSDAEMDAPELDAQPKPKQETVTDDNYYSTQSKFYA